MTRRIITVSGDADGPLGTERPLWYVEWSYDDARDKAVRLEQAVISLRALLSENEGVPL